MRGRVEQHRVSFALFATCTVGVIAVYMFYIARYGVNVIFWDEWSWTPLLHASHLSLDSFWVQHNEDRLFFPTLLADALINSTKWNDFAFFYVSAALMCATLFLIMYVFWKDILRSPAWWIPLPFLVLTLAQYQNILWAFQIAWPLVLVTMVGALVLLLRLQPSLLRIGIAIVLGVVASYSSIQGLLVWPAGLIILAARGQTWRARIVWSVAAIIAIPLYFVGFSYNATGGASLSKILGHLPLVLRGLLISIGSVIPTLAAGVSGERPSEIIGALLVIASVIIALAWWREGRPSGPKAFCVALIFVTLAFDVLLVPSRIIGSVTAGSASRYASFNWPLVVGVYAYVILWSRDAQFYKRPVQVFRASVALLVVAQIIVASYVGIQQGRIARNVRTTTADILANYRGAPLSLTAPYILPPCVVPPSPSYCSGMSAGVFKVEKAHVNVFSDSKSLLAYRSSGIVPGGIAKRQLPIPPVLRRKIESGGDQLKAWKLLSTIYASDSAVRTAFPLVRGVDPSLIVWAGEASRSVTKSDIIENAWAAPLGDAFFLQQYAKIYRGWAEAMQVK